MSQTVFYVHFQHGDCERRIALRDGETCLLGRTPDADFFLNHGSVSRRHCRLTGHKQGVEFQDLGSRNGCVYNGMRIDRVFLGETSIVQIGRLTFSVKVSTPQVPTLRCERCGQSIADWRVLGHSVSAFLVCENCKQQERMGTPELLRSHLAGVGFKVIETLSEDPLVIVAERIELGRLFRIKAIRVRPEEGDLEVERFKQEARLAASLEHPGIVKVVDIRSDSELVYVLMEHDGQETLEQRIESRGVLDVSKALSHTRAILSALTYAADRDVYHHNLTPAAVLFSSHGEPRLLDFKLGGWRLDLMSSVNKIEDESRGFLAPELFLGQVEGDSSSDIYGVGGLFHYMVTGQPPYHGTSMSVARAVMLKMAIEPNLEGVPEAFHGWLSKLLDLDPSKRPQSHEDVLRELDEVAMSFLMPGVEPHDSGERAAVRDDAARGEFSGSFVGDQLSEILQLIELHRKCGVLEVMSDGASPHRLSFLNGEIIDARGGNQEGLAAIRLTLALRHGTFYFVPDPKLKNSGTEAWKISALLLDFARLTDEAVRGPRG